MPRKNNQPSSSKRRKESTNLFQKLSLLAFDHAKLSLAIFGLLVLAGAASYLFLLKREGFPSIQTPISIASGAYFVDDADAIDRQLLQPVNDKLSDNELVKSVQTSTDANVFSIFVEYEESVDSSQSSSILQDAIAASNWPDQAQFSVPEIDVSKFLNEYTILLSMFSTDGQTNLEDLQIQASSIADAFAEVEGTTSAVVIEPFQRGVNPQTGEEATVQTGFSQYGELTDGQLNVVPNIIIGLTVTEGTDAIDYSELVNQKIDDLTASGELGSSRLAVAADNAPSILTQIDSLEGNLLTGLIAVSIISLLLITWRASIITAVFMLSVVLVTLLVLLLIGYTINTITLFSLVLALGLFVDDATIIVEAIDAGKSGKRKPRAIIKQAIGKVGAASFAGTFTTVLVFLPMAFISGILGSFIRILPITIIIALVTSLVLSMTLIPVLSRFILLRTPKRSFSLLGGIVRLLAKGISSLPLVFTRPGVLNKALGVLLTVVMLGISFGFFAGSGYFANRVSFDIFPSSKDSDVLSLNIAYPEGTTIDEAQTIANEVNQRVTAAVEPGIIESIAYSVTSASGFLSNEQVADAMIILKPFTERDIKSPEIIADLEESISDIENVKIAFGQLDAGPPVDEFPFKIQIFTDDLAIARQYAEDVRAFLQGAEVTRTNGTTASIVGTNESNFDRIVREDGMRFFQVGAAFDADDTTALVQSAQEKVEDDFNQANLASYNLNTEDIKFDFGQESDNQESFESMVFVGMLSVVAMYVLLGVQFGARSHHKLLSPSLFLVNAIVSIAAAAIVFMITEEVVGSVIAGALIGTAAHVFGTVFKPALIKPLLIFMAIPFSMFGVFFGLDFTDNPLSFFVMVGLFGLIGIVVNNTILLTDYANQERRAGKGPVQAISEATRKRFRPLLATSVTTVVALLPLALSDPFWEALAFTIIFGLLSSTILVVISFPYYYLLIESMKLGVAGGATRLWTQVRGER